MPAFVQYDWILALGFIFAFLDAYGIGANDVANSFATSVSSRSLTLLQATIAAAICEFLGAVLAGSRVTETIRSSIIQTSIFKDDPAVLMLAMLCALTASSIWLLTATRLGFTVSTTHSITGAVIGVGIAATGTAHSVKWGWKGVGGIFAAWGISPAIAGVFSSVTYLFIKYAVLQRTNSTKLAILFGPIFFFIVSGCLTMSIVWKGAPNLKLNRLSTGATVAAIFGTASVVCILSLLFWAPFVYCKVVRGDYTLRWYHFFHGPLLWYREPPADASEFTAPQAVPDYYEAAPHPEIPSSAASDIVKEKGPDMPEEPLPAGPSATTAVNHEEKMKKARDLPLPKFEGLTWLYPLNLLKIVKFWLIDLPWHNMTRDVISMQTLGNGDSKFEAHMRSVHARAKQYSNQTEHAYSFLQVMTACTMSFAHGSNDVSNAIGPFSTIYLIWKDGQFSSSKTPVPVWILVYGGAGIVIGLATYGYKMMSVLGNRITLHSPSRGFSMEFGTSITTILATRLSLPISTTQTITGATVAVGLCNGDAKAINWRAILWICFGWVLTMPLTGLSAGLLFAIITNSPRFGYASTIETA